MLLKGIHNLSHRTRMPGTRHISPSCPWILRQTQRASAPLQKVFLAQTPSSFTYHLGKKIGSGSFSEIWEASQDSQAATFSRALKIYHTNPDLPLWDFRNCATEFSHASCIDNPYVMKVFQMGVGSFQEQSRYYLELERVPGQSFYDYILEDFDRGGPPTNSLFAALDPVHFATQLSLGIKAIHDAQRLYLDIHPSNIVFDLLQPHLPPKWVDFGGSSQLQIPSPFISYSDGGHGTFSYGAPELIHFVEARNRQRPPKALDKLWREVGVRADLHSLGVLFGEIHGSLPEKNAKLPALIHRLTHRKKEKRLSSIEMVLHELRS